MNRIETWLIEQFEPWKQQAQTYTAQKAERINQLRERREVFQRVMGKLLDGQPKAAVDAWNHGGLQPALQKIHVDEKSEQLNILTRKGRRISLNLDAALQELAELLEKPTEPAPAGDF